MTDAGGWLDTTVGIEIAEAEFFRALAPEQMARVRPQLRKRVIRRGCVLFFEGRPAEALWLVAQGEVRLYKGSTDGRVTDARDAWFGSGVRRPLGTGGGSLSRERRRLGRRGGLEAPEGCLLAAPQRECAARCRGAPHRVCAIA